jgi:Resolvase, N terminal domain
MVFTETASGARSDRPVLEQVLDQLRPGDILVVWKLDRLGRSLRHLVDTIAGLAERGVGFRSLQEAIDTTTPGSKLVFHVCAASTPDPPGPKGGRPPRRGSLSTLCLITQNPHNLQNLIGRPVLWVLRVLSFVATPRGAPGEGSPACPRETWRCGWDRFPRSRPGVTLSNENRLSRSRPGRQSSSGVDGCKRPGLVGSGGIRRRRSCRSCGPRSFWDSFRG